MRPVKLYFLIFFALLLFSCQNNENVVVVYTSVDRVFSEPVLNDFEKETGIKIKAVYDTEETKSTGVLNRIIAEKDNPQCDVFWSGDPVRSVVLKQKGILEKYLPSDAADIPAVYKDPDGYWTGFSARARVLIFNKDLIDEKDVPQSIFDFTNEKYKGKIAMANPLFGTTTFHIAALFSVLGDDSAKVFLDLLKANDIVIASSNGDVKNRVANGEIPMGLTDTDDAHEALKEGKNIGVVFLDQQTNFGTLIMPNTVCLIKNSPNAENGKKLIDYLLSRQTEEKLAESAAQMPLHKGVKIPPDVFSLDNIIPMKINYNATAVKLEEIQNWLKNWTD